MKIYFTMLKTAVIIILLSTICIRSNAQNRKQLFDYDWKFLLGNDSSARKTDFDDSKWRKLDLPHDWSIEGKIDPKNPMGNDGGYFPAGIGWYRKQFTVPVTSKGKEISIYFEGVYMNAEVFINGKSLGVYPYGYTSFSYDLSQYLKYGAENTIAVKVDNSTQKNSRWYSGSGIYRHVWLITKPEVHVAQWGVGILTEQVSPKQADVRLSTAVKNASSMAKKVAIKTILLDAKNKKVGSATTNVVLPANAEQKIEQVIKVVKPNLWEPNQPHLYKANVQVVADKIEDQLTTKFGIRKIAFTATKGFELNDKTVKINGGNVHHDNGSLGAVAYDRAEIRKAELLKNAGFNAVRTSHNPPSEAFLNACDSIGLLVIDESFDGWRSQKNKYDYAMYFDKWAKKDVQAMVKRDRNHPSIVMWSIGNEIIERKEPQAVKTAKMLADAVKEIDSSRPVTSAMTTWDKDWSIFDPLMAEHDVAGYNYQLHRAMDDHKRVPSRVILQTESYPRDAFANWKLVNDHSYIIGDFVWTALDYLGESGIGRWYYSGEVTGEHYDRDLFPWHAAYCGDVDLTGWRKPISHYRSMLYNNDGEKLYIAVREPEPAPKKIIETLWSVWPTWESWTWPGEEGKPLEVEVYSKYPKVRLYLNDTLIGEKSTNEKEQFKATFSVNYTAGILKTVAVNADGSEGESKILKTVGETAQIKLSTDRSKLKADGHDLAYVTVELADANGELQPNAQPMLHFEIEGEGTLIGIDNADIKDTDPYVGQDRKAWKGRAVAVIKTKRKPGNITLTVSSPGLPASKLKIASN
ncbi:MAG: DUF4982 domain-containing protein [Pedobacter sp.]|nr:MAG: DUF4982 domain-containing protein [Pedobacter sp.]